MRQIYLLFFSLILVLLSCQSNPEGTGEYDQKIVILYTNDEHGWMEETEGGGGAARLMGLWRDNENFIENGDVLILSGGDMWTGPAISTWFQGESMVEVMNEMNYSAAAIGNHEFDFKIEAFKKRQMESNFPFLAANIRDKNTGEIPDFIQTFCVKDVGGTSVGIIGLSSLSTPYSTFPDHVIDYDFIDYGLALSEIMPSVLAADVELIVLIGHICSGEMRNLSQIAKTYGISMIGGGHCNEQYTEIVNDVALIVGGSYLNGYAKLEIYFNTQNNTVVNMVPSLHLNEGGNPDPAIAEVVSFWKSQMEDTLSRVIGYAEQTISRNTWEMYNMVCDSWLDKFPQADISMTNAGGIRQDIPAGDISLETVVGLMPFENTILQLELTGQQVMDDVANLIVGGMTTVGGFYLSDGSAIHRDSVYIVLTTDYLYSRPDFNFQYDDPDPYYTSVNYRQPLIDWMISMSTDPSNPINGYLDSTPRR